MESKNLIVWKMSMCSVGNNEMKFEYEFDVAYIEIHISF